MAHMRLKMACSKLAISVIYLFFVFGQIVAIAQTPSQPPDDLTTVLSQTAQQVLSTCQNWPPKIAEKQDDRTRKADDRRLKDGTTLITSQLAASFSLTAAIRPQAYGGSFLRLLDNVGTLQPNVPDNQLLGIALKVDPGRLNLWGVDRFVIKHDCISLLNLMSKGQSSIPIPFVSLDAAFQANLNNASNQASTFILGTFQSPFIKLYSSPDAKEGLFAALRAMNWRLNSVNQSQDQYVSTVTVLAIDRNLSVSGGTSLSGNLKAGVNIPLINASGSLEAELTQSLRSTNQTYITYYWNRELQKLPSLDELVAFVARNLPLFDYRPNAILTLSNTLEATALVEGWPDELCNPTAWKLMAKNVNFIPGQVDMKKGSTSSGLPSCNITVPFSLTDAAKVTPLMSSSIANPQLYLQYDQNGSVSVPINTRGGLSIAGKSSIILDPALAQWTVLSDPTSGSKANLRWFLSGHINVPNQRRISSVSVNPSDFKCKTQDNTILPLTGVRISGTPTPLNRIGDDPNFSLDVLLSLQTIPGYNDDVNQANKKACYIQGSLQVITTDSANISQQTESLDIQTLQVYYPNSLPTSTPEAPKNVKVAAGNGQVTLTWDSSSNASSYKVYRGNTASSEVVIKDGISSTSYIDAGLTNGAVYYYQVTAANVVGESPRSVEANVTLPSAPEAPRNVKLTAGNGQITLAWDASSNASSYSIYRATSAGAGVLVKDGVTSASYVDTGLASGMTYFYQVTASNVVGESPKSNEVNGVPKQ